VTSIFKIDVTFDLICPWCWIGKRNLDNALELVRRVHPRLVVQTNWHGVQLLPDIPEMGVPFSRFYEDRLGGEAAVRLRESQVRHAATQAGMQINFDRIKTFPHSGKAHRLLTFVKSNGKQAQFEAVLENLFEEYFIDGKNIGDEKVLLEIARNLHLNTASIAAAFAGPATTAVQLPPHSGVPHFVFDGRYRVFGAQQPQALASTISKIIKEGSGDDTPLSLAE
jgi:predicted DsbA family dithiol-disulfide isomerase